MRTGHRVMYEACHGPIPEGKIILHTCDNPKCFNPNHLKLGTMLDNYLDNVSKNRENLHTLKTCPHCKKETTKAAITRWHSECYNKIAHKINT